MLERIKNALQERKRDEKGFSLVELAVVIVIIGILVAIAVPVFMNIQAGARQAATDAAAANGAAAAAAEFAIGSTPTDATFASIEKNSDITITFAAASISDFCITATNTGGETATKGPTCA